MRQTRSSLVELVSQGPASLHIGTAAVHTGQSGGQRQVLKRRVLGQSGKCYVKYLIGRNLDELLHGLCEDSESGWDLINEGGG